jgi:hypothetical protein
MAPEDFQSEYPSWFDEFNTILYGDESGDGEEDPVWYNFIINEELESWAVLATWDEDFETFYIWNALDEVCKLTPDWKNPDNRDENIWGFFVSYEEGYECPYIEANGFTYS